MKFVLNKRFGGRRVVLVVVSCRKRPRLRAVASSSIAAVIALYGLRRLGRLSGVSARETAAPNEASERAAMIPDELTRT